MDKDFVVAHVVEQAKWWTKERIKKLEGLNHETMAVNPFLMPLIRELQGLKDFDEISEFLLGAHFYQGHATGFGKLIDEKILPRVFGTTKLDRAYRGTHPPFHKSIYDEIDHIVYKDGTINLLSQKAGRWTIQLTMAVQLNESFRKIIIDKGENQINFDKIVVGVFYGKRENLTDKFDILRGINRGQNHDVTDLTSDVLVYAGKEFWSWLNDNEQDTQEWVLEGLMVGMREGMHEFGDPTELIENYKSSFNNTYAPFIDENNNIDWSGILAMING